MQELGHNPFQEEPADNLKYLLEMGTAVAREHKEAMMYFEQTIDPLNQSYAKARHDIAAMKQEAAKEGVLKPEEVLSEEQPAPIHPPTSGSLGGMGG